MANPAIHWNDIVSSAIERAAPGVVHIDGHCGIGFTGVAWSPDQVLTTHYGLGRGDRFEVALEGGELRAASVIGRDPGTDLALLSVAGGELTPLERAGLDDLKVGHTTVALGRPGRALRASLRIAGVLGGRVDTPRGGSLDRYLETDRRLPYGFSGGPLIDLEGRLLGLNTRALFRGADVAVPVQTIERVIATFGEVV